MSPRNVEERDGQAEDTQLGDSSEAGTNRQRRVSTGDNTAKASTQVHARESPENPGGSHGAEAEIAVDVQGSTSRLVPRSAVSTQHHPPPAQQEARSQSPFRDVNRSVSREEASGTAAGNEVSVVENEMDDVPTELRASGSGVPRGRPMLRDIGHVDTFKLVQIGSESMNKEQTNNPALREIRVERSREVQHLYFQAPFQRMPFRVKPRSTPAPQDRLLVLTSQTWCGSSFTQRSRRLQRSISGDAFLAVFAEMVSVLLRLLETSTKHVRMCGPQSVKSLDTFVMQCGSKLLSSPA